MIKTSTQLKDLIRNLSKEKAADAQLLLRNYMMERFLERISQSSYRDHFILKGGLLVAALVGLEARSTMDLDATIKGLNVSVEDVENIVASIVSVPADDGVTFRVNRIAEIMEEAEYPGVRVSMEAHFDGARSHLKLDISTGDVITPKEIRYNYKLMLEDRSIEVWAYNLETVLAEKLETIIRRGVANTRMRDFYDIHILQCIYRKSISSEVLRDALTATARKRGSAELLGGGRYILEGIEKDSHMQDLWRNYQKSYSYAESITWQETMQSVKDLLTTGVSNQRTSTVCIMPEADMEFEL